MLAISHFGAFFQVMPALGLRGYKVNQVANLKPPEVERSKGRLSRFVAATVFKKRFASSGKDLPANVIALESGSSMMPLFRCLKRNEILIMALDGRDMGKLSPFRFFHHDDYLFATGPVDLALRTECAMHPMFIVRGPDLHNTLVIEPAVSLERGPDKEEDLVRNTAKFAAILQDYVSRHPAHYGMEILFYYSMLPKLAALGQVPGVPAKGGDSAAP